MGEFYSPITLRIRNREILLCFIKQLYFIDTIVNYKYNLGEIAPKRTSPLNAYGL